MSTVAVGPRAPFAGFLESCLYVGDVGVVAIKLQYRYWYPYVGTVCDQQRTEPVSSVGVRVAGCQCPPPAARIFHLNIPGSRLKSTTVLAMMLGISHTSV